MPTSLRRKSWHMWTRLGVLNHRWASQNWLAESRKDSVCGCIREASSAGWAKKTAMTQSAWSLSPAGDMVERYEDLRRQVLSQKGVGHGGRGLVLFLRQGMKAWMEAWLGYPIAGPMKAPIESDSTGSMVPWDLRGEVAAILAGMALSIGQEMSA